MTKVQEIKGQRLHDLRELWRKGQLLSVNGYLLMGKAIHFLRQERLWQFEDNQVPTYKYWVEHELQISVSQAYRLEQVYLAVGEVLLDIAIPIDISKVTLLLPHIEDKTDQEKADMLEEASNLTVEDIKNNLKDINGQPEKATDVCEHEETELLSRCRQCGKWIR